MSTSRWDQITVACIALVEAALLYLSGSSLATHGQLYGCTQFCGTDSQHLVTVFAALFSIIILVLPIVIGALCSSWERAVLWSSLPWLVATIGHAGSLLAPVISLAVQPGPFGGAFGAPFWLDLQRSGALLISLLLFGLLGFLGWLARRALRAGAHPF